MVAIVAREFNLFQRGRSGACGWVEHLQARGWVKDLQVRGWVGRDLQGIGESDSGICRRICGMTEEARFNRCGENVMKEA